MTMNLFGSSLTYGLDAAAALASVAFFATGFAIGSFANHTRQELTTLDIDGDGRPAGRLARSPLRSARAPHADSDGEEDLASLQAEIGRVLASLYEQRVNTTCAWRRAGLLVLAGPPARTLAQEVHGALELIQTGDAFMWHEPYVDDAPVDLRTIDGALDALHALLRTLFVELAQGVHLPSPAHPRTPRKRTRFANGSSPGSSPGSGSGSARHAGHTPWAARPGPSALKAMRTPPATPARAPSSRMPSSASSSASTAPAPMPLFATASSVDPSPHTPSSRASTMPGTSPLKRTFAFYDPGSDEDDERDDDSPLQARSLRGPVRTTTSANIFQVQPAPSSLSQASTTSFPAAGTSSSPAPAAATSSTPSPTATTVSIDSEDADDARVKAYLRADHEALVSAGYDTTNEEDADAQLEYAGPTRWAMSLDVDAMNEDQLLKRAH